MNPDCAWCTGQLEHPRWPDCDCRTECASTQCLPGFDAAEVTPGMAIHHPHGGSKVDNSETCGVLDVLGVAGPDSEGWMYLTSFHETVRIACDWRVSLYTQADADLSAALLMDAQDRYLSTEDPR